MSKRGYLRSKEKEQFWRDVFRGHGKSGMNIRDFCRVDGLKEWAVHHTGDK